MTRNRAGTGQTDSPTSGTEPDISVLIATRDRPESLGETLRLLAEADRTGLRAEVVVIDNSEGDPATRAVVAEAGERMPVRYLAEPRRGKGPAFNRALDAGGLGALIAVLDDDMSPHRDWFQGVAAATARYPDHGLFTGSSYIIWPEGVAIPPWAHRGDIVPWAFSVIDNSEGPSPIAGGRWPSGNFYWYRRSCLHPDRRYNDSWICDEAFTLSMSADGILGVMVPDAVAGHRVQPELLEEATIWARAELVGRQFPRARLPYATLTLQGKMLHKHPVLWRVMCVANLLRWCGAFAIARCRRDPDRRFADSVLARLGLFNNWETLRIAGSVEKYFGRPAGSPGTHAH